MAGISKKLSQCSLQEVKGTGGAKGVCERHQEPLKLFCRDHEAPICVVCDKSKEHRDHQVIPVEEAAEEYKEKIQVHLKSLKGARLIIGSIEECEEQSCQDYLDQLQVEKWEITSDFEQMHKFLEAQERVWLTQLAEVENEIKKRLREHVSKLTEEVDHFIDLIRDVEVKCQQPPSEFLQDIRHTLSRCEEVRRCPQLPLGLLWRFRSCCPKSSVIKKAMGELTGSLKQALGKVSVTLDPGTGNPWLALSEDLKSVSYGNSKQDLPDKTERFDLMPCVLGRERFTSGRHWWEVEVEVEAERLSKGIRWAVGVARESLGRKESLIISPNEGIWAVGKVSPQPHVYSTLNYPELEPFALDWQPRKIRVFLDYEEGCVEFFDADTDNRHFDFTPGSFSGEGIRPFFWVGQGVSLRC